MPNSHFHSQLNRPFSSARHLSLIHISAFELAKNPDYYDADSISLDGLAYQVIKDSQQALMSYQTCLLYTSRCV